MPSNERVAMFQELTSALQRRRLGLPAELAELINDFVRAGGMHSDAMLWDHTNASLACSPDALLNLLAEAVAVGRVLQDRELARDQRCTLCNCTAVATAHGFPVCNYHRERGESDPACPKCVPRCRCGAELVAGGALCSSDPTPPRCSKCGHKLSHGACPLCAPAQFLQKTGRDGYPG